MFFMDEPWYFNCFTHVYNFTFTLITFASSNDRFLLELNLVLFTWIIYIAMNVLIITWQIIHTILSVFCSFILTNLNARTFFLSFREVVRYFAQCPLIFLLPYTIILSVLYNPLCNNGTSNFQIPFCMFFSYSISSSWSS